jgi:cyclophilin family peptidyl-prolyl cis-trans isomerase
VETVKGTFEFETYPDEAPQTVEHVLRLVKRNFYNGLRVHRVVPNFVVQMGDPQTRDMTKREWWGRGDFSGSGKPVGVAEFSKKRLHVRGAVAMAHAGNAAQADAQFYVLLGDTAVAWTASTPCSGRSSAAWTWWRSCRSPTSSSACRFGMMARSGARRFTDGCS